MFSVGWPGEEPAKRKCLGFAAFVVLGGFVYIVAERLLGLGWKKGLGNCIKCREM